MPDPRPIQLQPDLFAHEGPLMVVPTTKAMTDLPTLMALLSMLLAETMVRPIPAEDDHEDHV